MKPILAAAGQMKSLKGLSPSLAQCTPDPPPAASSAAEPEAGEEKEEEEGAEKKAPAGAASVPGPGPPCRVYSAVLSHPLIHPLDISLAVPTPG